MSHHRTACMGCQIGWSTILNQDRPVTSRQRRARVPDPPQLAEAGPPEAFRLPIQLIDPNPSNPRAQLIEVEALADNIRTFGLLQPVTVRRRGPRYELLGGHRRLAAFALLREREPLEPQWRTIPAVVRTEDDDDRSYLMLISSQVHNRAWRPREEAAALERLVLAGRNLKQVGEALNRTESWASKRLRVYADAVLSGYAQTGKLAVGVAEELLTVADVTTRRNMAERAISEGWSKDVARGQVRALRLDRQLRELGRRAREMVDLLASVESRRVPIEIARDLWTLHGLVERMATGAKPRFPSIEAAQRAAGVHDQERRLKPGERRRPGYKPRT